MEKISKSKLPIINKHDEVLGYTTVDSDVYEKYKDKRITLSGKYPAHKKTRLHVLIMNPKQGEIVDHVNRNNYDNTRSNLRITDRKGNNRNIVAKGYYWHKHKQKYHVRITVDYKVIHIGYYDTPEEAQKVYREHHVKYFGEYSPYFNK